MYVNRWIDIDERWLDEHFIRASGPGGQNVNRVATAVQLRFDLASCTDLTDQVKHRLQRIASGRISANGILIIDARRFRTQHANRMDARKRLQELILQAMISPRQRRRTRPSPSADRRRLEEKSRRKQIKQNRQRVSVSHTD
ncbi:MAG: alternative ribosome rescue aminoacyl-tRNA hydrolase ArfB [Acidobacteriota bacterium]|jgi:ribosome-associated protein|nr:alternative ribosome rescue aminoacyl-tRNA hydrolase ArfB [Acidobacteriota bacterium]